MRNDYRFGFNGKQKDNEVLGVGNSYDYGFRRYDPQTVGFWSVDPLYRKYPWLSPYQFASNSTIVGIDLDGKEFTFNKWVFNLFFGWINDFKEGANQLQRGVTREVAVNSGQMDYQRPEVPERIQRINAEIDKLKAASDEVSEELKCM